MDFSNCLLVLLSQWENDFVFDEGEDQEDYQGEGDEENKYYSGSELEDDSVCLFHLTFVITIQCYFSLFYSLVKMMTTNIHYNLACVNLRIPVIVMI